MTNYHISLFPDGIYHVLSRAVGDELLFREEENYRFFLQRYIKYISPIADTFAFTLMPNHFHFIIRIKNETVIQAHYKEKKPNKECKTESIPDFIMEQFSNFLNSYTKSLNKRYARKGALFMDYLRRVEVKTDLQFGATIFYIHKNPVHHGYVKTIADWHWSSFKIFLSISPTMLCRNEVLNWFGGKEQFIYYHEQPVYLKNAAELE